MALETFQVIALLDGRIRQSNPSQNPVLRLIFFRSSEQQIRVEEQAYRVAALDAVSRAPCNVQAATQVDLTQQLQEDRFRHLARKAQSIADQASRLQRPQLGWILLCFVGALANLAELDAEFLNRGM